MSGQSKAGDPPDPIPLRAVFVVRARDVPASQLPWSQEIPPCPLNIPCRVPWRGAKAAQVGAPENMTPSLNSLDGCVQRHCAVVGRGSQ